MSFIENLIFSTGSINAQTGAFIRNGSGYNNLFQNTTALGRSEQGMSGQGSLFRAACIRDGIFCQIGLWLVGDLCASCRYNIIYFIATQCTHAARAFLLTHTTVLLRIKLLF